ncbi:MAG TPA: hypothetical protein VF731_05150 [Solirubrobacterales bacterium]
MGEEQPARKALRHYWRVRIVAACTVSAITVRQFLDRAGVPEQAARGVRHHFRKLQLAGFLGPQEGMARGLRQYIYAALRQGLITDAEFAQMPIADRREVSKAYFDDLDARIKEAVEADTVDGRENSHLTWAPLGLDQRGFNDVMETLHMALARVLEIGAESRARRRSSREPVIPATVALMGFESPPEKG